MSYKYSDQFQSGDDGIDWIDFQWAPDHSDSDNDKCDPNVNEQDWPSDEEAVQVEHTGQDETVVEKKDNTPEPEDEWHDIEWLRFESNDQLLSEPSINSPIDETNDSSEEVVILKVVEKKKQRKRVRSNENMPAAKKSSQSEDLNHKSLGDKFNEICGVVWNFRAQSDLLSQTPYCRI